MEEDVLEQHQRTREPGVASAASPRVEASETSVELIGSSSRNTGKFAVNSAIVRMTAKIQKPTELLKMRS